MNYLSHLLLKYESNAPATEERIAAFDLAFGRVDLESMESMESKLQKFLLDATESYSDVLDFLLYGEVVETTEDGGFYIKDKDLTIWVRSGIFKDYAGGMAIASVQVQAKYKDYPITSLYNERDLDKIGSILYYITGHPLEYQIAYSINVLPAAEKEKELLLDYLFEKK